jgi:hypothetical protein
MFNWQNLFFIPLQTILIELYSDRRMTAISMTIGVNESRKIIWAGDVARMEEAGSVLKILTGKPTGRRPLGRPRHR